MKARFLILAVALFIIDRISKYIALVYLAPGFFCCGEQLGLSLLYNPGIAFGISFPQILSLSLATIIILGLLFILIKKYNSRSAIGLFAFELIIIGAVSNLIDRIRFGQIVDFIHLAVLPVFNLADLFILTGIFMLIYFESKK